MNPMENVVCTIGLMNAGTRYNVGVEDAYLEGTVRTYTPALRDKMEARLGEILKGLDVMFGTHSELNYVRGHSATINTPEKIQFLQEFGKTYVAPDPAAVPVHVRGRLLLLSGKIPRCLPVARYRQTGHTGPSQCKLFHR